MKKKLSELTLNRNNPRNITEYHLGKLVESILSFPKMLELRPIVIREGVIIGGNQRFKALCEIADFDISEIEDTLFDVYKFQEMEETEQRALIDYWAEWLEDPVAVVKDAELFNDHEEKQFVVKDNVSFGEEDISILRTNFDIHEVESYTGSINQLAYDFSDDINDEEIEERSERLLKLKCAYIESVLTDEEYEWLIERYIDQDGDYEFFVKQVLLCK